MPALPQTAVTQPIGQARLTVMRDETSSNAEFRAALRELATLLVYEATRNLATVGKPIRTPVTPTEGLGIANPPLLVPVLSARRHPGRTPRAVSRTGP